MRDGPPDGYDHDDPQRLRFAANRSAAEDLLGIMLEWSEETACAQWLVGLEVMADDAIAGRLEVVPTSELYLSFKIDQPTLDALRRARSQAGGTWVYFGDLWGGVVFVTEAEWSAMGRKDPSDTDAEAVYAELLRNQALVV